MNLDELAKEIQNISHEKVIQELSRHLLEWKTNNKTAENLKDEIEKYIGSSWVESDEDHEKVYQLWSSFRDEAILGIGGMTMNERLYFFGLLNRFDSTPNQESRLIVYKKLHAKP